MESSFIRQKFRLQIRERGIQKIKKARRQLCEIEIQRDRQKRQNQQLYMHILHNPHLALQNKEDYLQLLRQTLAWEHIGRHTQLFNDIALNLVKFYDQDFLTENTILLFLECICLIFHEGKIQFVQISKKCLQICFQYLNKNEFESSFVKKVRNRCLIGILNITSHQNQQIMQLCVELQILECLENQLDTFPFFGDDKSHILAIYGNLIGYEVHIGSTNFYPNLLQSCYEENYNEQVLERAVQIFNFLISNKSFEARDLISLIELLLFVLLNADFYVLKSEKLITNILMFLLENKNHLDTDTHSTFAYCEDALTGLVNQYSQKVDAFELSCSFLWMVRAIKQSQQFQEEVVNMKVESLVKDLCNFWANSEDDLSEKFEINALEFLKESLTATIIQKLFEEYGKGIEGHNDIGAPAWYLIQKFLSSVKLSNPQICYSFISLFDYENIFNFISRQKYGLIMQQIEGCFYMKENQISQMAQRVLEKAERSKSDSF